jgi:hypothetical protein
MMMDEPSNASLQQSGSDSVRTGEGTEAVYLSSNSVAKLMEIELPTLRNYVWLLGMSKTIRQRRFLQHPPENMPKPKKVRGRLVWDAKIFNAWLVSRLKSN